MPRDCRMKNLIEFIKKHIKVQSDESIYLFIEDKIIHSSQKVKLYYDKYRSKDGFLYVTFSEHSTFGGQHIN